MTREKSYNELRAAVADPRYPRWEVGTNTKGGTPTYYFDQYFPKTA